VIRQSIIADANGNPQVITDRNSVIDDALGGRYYYLGHAELEIPLGSGARELGLRPSIFLDVGSVWGVKRPLLQSSPFPNGIFIPARDATGSALYQQVDTVTQTTNTDGSTTCSVATVSQVTSATSTVALPCLPTGLTAGVNTALGSSVAPFQEIFQGNSWRPRVSIGIGVNWNSPFGPFRIDFAKVLLKRPGDDTKSFTFNVGTQF
jgi:outer membrane protein insertion porin family